MGPIVCKCRVKLSPRKEITHHLLAKFEMQAAQVVIRPDKPVYLIAFHDTGFPCAWLPQEEWPGEGPEAVGPRRGVRPRRFPGAVEPTSR